MTGSGEAVTPRTTRAGEAPTDPTAVAPAVVLAVALTVARVAARVGPRVVARRAAVGCCSSGHSAGASGVGGTGGGVGSVGGIGGGAENSACSSGTVCAGAQPAMPWAHTSV